MSVDSDPNVIYGGDLEETSEVSFARYASLGDLIVQDLKIGENKTSFVSLAKFLPLRLKG